MLLSIYNSLTRQKKLLIVAGLLALLTVSSGAAVYYQSVVRQSDTTADGNAKDDTKITSNRPGTITSDAPNANSDNATQDKPTADTGVQTRQSPISGSAPTNTKPGASSNNTSNNGGSTTAPQPTCPTGQIGTPPNCSIPEPKPVGVNGNWTLKFQDDFNGGSLNTNIWATQRGQANGSYGDPYNPQYEDAFYVANNPKVTGGNLVLTLNKTATNGYPYSSGMVQNGRNFSYKYGYTEARIKVPGNTGVWPAYWTLASPIDQYWPPEIDIFEFGLDGNSQPSFNYHYGSWPNNSQFGLKKYGNPAINYSQDFHTYGMLWTPNVIQVFLDGSPGPSYTVSSNITSLPQYLILNLGLKKGANVPNGTAMYVDYVRVWQ